VSRRLRGIRTQVSRLNTLVDSFLLSEASDQGPLVPKLTPVSMSSYLQGVKHSLSEEMHEFVAVQVAPTSLQAQVDVRLLSLALHNLLDNALRYGPHGSDVELTARLQGRDLLITVADRGPGLPDAELPLLGTPYHRGSSSAGTQGTGLGYHFSGAITHAHGGRIEAINRPDGGLQVTMRLPQ
jgi:two-component system sensor histidine kinase KdpD